mmetsp:Transcript_75635/g.200915  ORF Transcript_75635/g.200915 Transcript_75635/m.200915 type:complete len:269 (-) Transcript_75635:852-1658(-)
MTSRCCLISSSRLLMSSRKEDNSWVWRSILDRWSLTSSCFRLRFSSCRRLASMCRSRSRSAPSARLLCRSMSSCVLCTSSCRRSARLFSSMARSSVAWCLDSSSCTLNASSVALRWLLRASRSASSTAFWCAEFFSSNSTIFFCAFSSCSSCCRLSLATCSSSAFFSESVMPPPMRCSSPGANSLSLLWRSSALPLTCFSSLFLLAIMACNCLVKALARSSLLVPSAASFCWPCCAWAVWAARAFPMRASRSSSGSLAEALLASGRGL